MSSATENRIIRSIDFLDHVGEQPQSEVEFLIVQLGDYIRENFEPKTNISTTLREESFGNRDYVIRKGSGVIEVKTIYGLNSRYVGNRKESFPSFTIRAAYRNEALDQIEQLNASIEFTSKLAMGAVFGFLGLILSFLLHGSTFLLLGAVGLGSAIGAGLGSLIGQKLFEWKEQSLRAQGEIDEMDTEWAMLEETLAILFDQRETFRYNATGTRNWR